MTQQSEEPTIPGPVTLETLSGDEWQPHVATIANLTRGEVWIGIDEPLGELLHPERRVRLVLRHEDREAQTAETIVLWHIGSDGRLVALMRPTFWDPPSRRAHSRAWLAIPIHLHHSEAEPPASARTTNVGVGGVHCLSDVAVPVGQKLSVSLKLTPDQSFDCRAEVVRVEANTDDPSGRQVVIGLRFEDLTQDEQATLALALADLAADVDADFVPLAWRTAATANETDA